MWSVLYTVSLLLGTQSCIVTKHKAVNGSVVHVVEHAAQMMVE